MRSSPGTHNAFVARENTRLGGKLKPLIQSVKAWKFYNNVPITSFYLELMVTRYAQKETSIVYRVDLYYIIKELYNAGLSRIEDPMKISGLVAPCKSYAKKLDALSKLGTAFSRAEKAYELREKNVDLEFYWWNMFFNQRFPAR